MVTQKYAAAEPPLRAVLFSADQMERHGRTLAESHRLTRGRGPDKLLARLTDNGTVLADACELLTQTVKANRRITPAGDWLLDNFYLIEEQIRTARRHFPKGYSRELPLLANGTSAGLPRVYDIALEAISHGDGRVDPESLNRFVASYQKTSGLQLGELWAIPIMLRLALIENMRRVGTRVAAGIIDRNRANSWADQMVDVAERDPKSLILVIADMARSNPPLVNSFVAELARRLQGHSSALALPLTWIEQRLGESGLTIEALVQSETQSQAANQVSISNSIGSLRLLAAIDWRDFVESMSAVEQKLREDPDGIYAQMDFGTRDQYRHVIEKIARHSELSEFDVARKAVQLAHQGKAQSVEGGNDRKAHVGYFLIDNGRPELERSAEARFSLLETLRRFDSLGRRVPLLLYLGSIGLLTTALAGCFFLMAVASGLAGWLLAGSGIAAILAASQLATALVNWLATLLASPQLLPRMDFSKGIPSLSRTLVIVPTMISNRQSVDELAEALEVRFLANRDPNLHFGLLTDFPDASLETLPEDAAIQQRAGALIDALNLKYTGTDHDTFFLFHRPRRWNAEERIWMGYERKRGKLADLNALLRSGSAAPFSLIVGRIAILREVKYVITLDTDTQLPRDSARELAGTMAHPLNRARYDHAQQRVTEGYGILQPRVAVSLPSTNRSRFAQLCGSDSGLDPYTRAVSDVYQDLFHEGSYVGKGIYDVDIFERSLKDRLPENRILSHDLLEGCYARAGLLSDVQLYEDYPARYGADVSRRHRWIRGDWQIATWLLSSVPGPGAGSAKRLRNPLSRLSQWKLLDNLRRSLVPAALLLLFLFGWAEIVAVQYWTLAILGIFFLPALITSGLRLLGKPENIRTSQHVSASLRATGRQLGQATLDLACLPYEASFSIDAVVRTTIRVLITRRRLLEWNPSGEPERSGDVARKPAPKPGGTDDLMQSLATMWVAPATATVTTLYLFAARPGSLAVAGAILCLWFVAPVLTWWISRPLARQPARLRPSQTRFLHVLTRRTWAFFESFVTAADHWLPPDNYQEQPVAALAHRTSPTNMGLALLANLAAHDFGFVSAGTLIERTSSALASMSKLERYQGHFYNWYDTLTLAPLRPLYVSSVDSGNLAGHLLTLRPGLRGLIDEKIVGPRVFAGLDDTLAVIEDLAHDIASQEVGRLRRDVEAAQDSGPTTITAANHWLGRLSAAADTLAGVMPVTPAEDVAAAAGNDLGWWVDALVRQIRDLRAELEFLAPWSMLQAIPDRLLRDLPGLVTVPTLRELSMLDENFAASITGGQEADATKAELASAAELHPLVALGSFRARARIAAIEELARQSGELAQFDYSFLYDQAVHLLAVGYNVDQRRRDSGHYDLLASEARLCSFVAIAQGAVPQENWFALGRQLTTAAGESILLSWSGSMFEYLMPLLVMPAYENTLLDQTCRAAVKSQIQYGNQRGVPWGISESGYNTVDAGLNYQYRAFGVPGLGLKRGLAEDLVIAPYASVLALMVMPEAACQNLQRLANDGLLGKLGMYEAVDFTPSRLPRGQSSTVVRSFMAHHQGMAMLSLAYLLLDRPMQKRFETDPQFQATMLLLQERIPVATALHRQAPDLAEVRPLSIGQETPMRVLTSADTRIPEVQLLSNGRYHVMVTNAGGGCSRWKDLAVTRWHEDGTRDNWGMFCYLRDVATGAFWSTAHQPTLKQADTYEAIFSEGRAEFRRRDHDIETHTEIVVSPEDDIELRRIHITNCGRVRRTIEITSYAEVVLAAPAADALHPAFSNLFVQTEILRDRQAILCNRRPRSVDEHSPWMFHQMAARDVQATAVSYETDRMRFIGRTRRVDSPLAMTETGPLSGGEGSVLDPIVAIRCRITLEAEQTATVDVVSGMATSRQDALGLVGKYGDRHLASRVFDLAWTHSWVSLRQIDASESDAQLYGRLAGSVIYANNALRADAAVLARNRRGQSGLWGYAISGDLPIVLLQIGDIANIELVRQMVRAHAYWRLKGLAVDLVIWNEDHAGYRQALQEQIMGLIAAGNSANVTDRPGGIFVRAVEQISAEDRTLFQSVARLIVTDGRGTLADQISRREPRGSREQAMPPFVPTRQPMPRTGRARINADPPQAHTDLQFFNGFGGFSRDGQEYIVTVNREKPTPAPWVNVIANPHFGTVISESGAAYSWSENAHEFRLTPWSDDPVSDSTGEAIYLRDEETGNYWSPTLLPCGGETHYVTRHGFGYSQFEHEEQGVRSVLTIFVDTEAAVKLSVLRISNLSDRARRLSATGYVEWVMGDLRPKSAMHIVTTIDPVSGALCAHNPYSTEFADRIAFFDADDAMQQDGVTFTGDRREFLGRNGTHRRPASMSRAGLSNRVGAGLDPCGAIQVPFELAAGQSREIIFRLGAKGRRNTDGRELVQRLRGADVAQHSLAAVRNYWRHTLDTVQVDTPDPALNILANGWLLYQTLACRIWARSGFYQSGGAFGFRDQLQDFMSLVYAEPLLVRDHLLLCAARQFVEGDVQHWWHPPTGRGVRTRCTDDFLWLPQATCRYVVKTGDVGVLGESIPFLEGRPVNAEDDSYYDLPGRSGTAATLYQHCVRAILRGLRFGEHGLPLMGSGDWNDVMNLVGIQGRGESVWLGFFLYDTLVRFGKVASLNNDAAFADRCRAEADQLRRNIEQHGWDGEWYRRAYFDDGGPLGSASNDDCQIDSISQSWSVLSAAADGARARMAMDAVDRRLVRRDHALVQLLDPPFDKSALNPGYIKGYVPGVRENGGQYTHGAIWAAMAFAAQGDSRRAWELFNMINPVNHTNSADSVATYKAEPYVMAADVYALSPHIGRGGWTWYTGSAGWMYRLIVDSLLGLHVEGGRLRFAPCLPADWAGFNLSYRHGETNYSIALLQSSPGGPLEDVTTVDGVVQRDSSVELADDGKNHVVEVRLSRTPA